MFDKNFVVIARTVRPVQLFSPQTIEKMVLDSSATDNMSGNKSYFVTLILFPDKTRVVLLGDGSTKIPVHVIGTIDIIINEKYRIKLHNVLYVPDLADTLFSVKSHMKYLHCSFLAANNNITLNFPDTPITADTDPEAQVYIKATPPNSNLPIIFDSSNAALAAKRTTTTSTFQVKLTSNNARTPTKGSSYSAG